MKEAHTEYDTSRWTFQRGRRSVFALAVVAIAAAACGGGDSTTGTGTGTGTQPPPAAATPVGTYSIMTVNAKALPVALFSDTNYKYEVTVGSLALTADGKYLVITTYKQTIPDNVTTFVDTTNGTWVLTGANVAFTNGQDASKDNAVFDKDQLTFAEANGKVTPLSVRFGPKSSIVGQTLIAARLAAAADPTTYVYKK